MYFQEWIFMYTGYGFEEMNPCCIQLPVLQMLMTCNIEGHIQGL
jgi:hypothetical protein